jgi:hypothetical protein
MMNRKNKSPLPEKIAEQYLSELYTNCIHLASPEIPQNQENPKPINSETTEKQLISDMKSIEKQSRELNTPTNGQIVLGPVKIKQKKKSMKSRKRNERGTRGSVHGIQEMVRKKRESTQKKLKALDWKLKSLKTENEADQIKSFLKDEWRRVKHEGESFNWYIIQSLFILKMFL